MIEKTKIAVNPTYCPMTTLVTPGRLVVRLKNRATIRRSSTFVTANMALARPSSPGLIWDSSRLEVLGGQRRAPASASSPPPSVRASPASHRQLPAGGHFKTSFRGVPRVRDASDVRRGLPGPMLYQRTTLDSGLIAHAARRVWPLNRRPGCLNVDRVPEPPLLNTLEVLFVWASHFRHSIGYRPYRWWLAIGY